MDEKNWSKKSEISYYKCLESFSLRRFTKQITETIGVKENGEFWFMEPTKSTKLKAYLAQKYKVEYYVKQPENNYKDKQ